MENQLLKKLQDGKIVLGLSNMYPASGIIEGMCQGWDFVWIDAQHGQHDYNNILQAVRTAHLLGIDSIVRVPGKSSDFLGLVADMSPSAIMIPMVNTPQEAQSICEALHFPPLGNRSYGGRRVIDLHGRDYFQNQELAVFIQIENQESLDCVETFAEIKGVDCLFFGPDDMKVQLGLPINIPISESPELGDAMRRMAKAAKEAGIYAACPVPTVLDMDNALNMGYQLFACGGDSAFLRSASVEKRAEINDFLGKKFEAI